MGLLRTLLLLAILAGGAFLLFGYWAGGGFDRWGGAGDGVGTSGEATADEARERAAELGERASEASARAGDAVRDAAVTARIKAKMALDDAVKARSIDVTTDGTTVTLAGRVYSELERDRALRLARETEGVENVVDRLSVQP